MCCHQNISVLSVLLSINLKKFKFKETISCGPFLTTVHFFWSSQVAVWNWATGMVVYNLLISSERSKLHIWTFVFFVSNKEIKIISDECICQFKCVYYFPRKQIVHANGDVLNAIMVWKSQHQIVCLTKIKFFLLCVILAYFSNDELCKITSSQTDDIASIENKEYSLKCIIMKTDNFESMCFCILLWAFCTQDEGWQRLPGNWRCQLHLLNTWSIGFFYEDDHCRF